MRPGGRHKRLRVLGIDAALNRVPGEMNLARGVVQLFACRDPDLRFDQIGAGHKLRHRMLYLDSRIHLDEVDRAVAGVHQELDGARVGVADLLQRLHYLRAHFLAKFRIEHRRRRFLDQFLVAPLNRALPLAQVNHFAVLVAEHLEFDVPRALDEPLGVNVRRAKCLLRLAPRRLVGGQQFLLLAYRAHTAPAAARHRFQNQRIADLCRFLGKLLFPFDGPVASRDGRQPGVFHFAPRAVLLAHHFNDFRPRTDEGNLGRFAHFREVRILGQKPVAGMNGVHVGDFRGADYVGDVQITFAAARRPDAHGFIGKAHVQRIPVGLRIDGDRLDSQLLARADDPQGDLAAVGYQNFVEHRESPPTSCGSAGFQTRAARIPPAARFLQRCAALPRSCRTQFHSSASSLRRCTRSGPPRCSRRLSQKARTPGLGDP
jgi:hypothetical protein